MKRSEIESLARNLGVSLAVSGADVAVTLGCRTASFVPYGDDAYAAGVYGHPELDAPALLLASGVRHPCHVASWLLGDQVTVVMPGRTVVVTLWLGALGCIDALATVLDDEGPPREVWATAELLPLYLACAQKSMSVHLLLDELVERGLLEEPAA